jgi:RNA polymerase sigma factor (sigma-70 family)
MTVPAQTDTAFARLPPFATVLEQHGPALLRFCRAQVGSDRGDDVFQETMLAALRAYADVHDATAVRAWLFAIAARKAVDAHRSTARAPVPTADADLAQGSSTTPDGGEIWEQVARLPQKQRQAVTLRFMADLSHREIAEVMAISEDAVRRNVFEGLRRLRRDLTNEPV